MCGQGCDLLPDPVEVLLEDVGVVSGEVGTGVLPDRLEQPQSTVGGRCDEILFPQDDEMVSHVTSEDTFGVVWRERGREDRQMPEGIERGRLE